MKHILILLMLVPVLLLAQKGETPKVIKLPFYDAKLPTTDSTNVLWIDSSDFVGGALLPCVRLHSPPHFFIVLLGCLIGLLGGLRSVFLHSYQCNGDFWFCEGFLGALMSPGHLAFHSLVAAALGIFVGSSVDYDTPQLPWIFCPSLLEVK